MNPTCKCCGDDASPSLSNRGWCVYCEHAYEEGKKEERNRWIEKFKEYACIKDDGWFLDWVNKISSPNKTQEKKE